MALCTLTISEFHKCGHLKIQVQGHGSRSQCRYNTLSTHILFVLCRSALPFLVYNYFKIWQRKFKVKVMGEVKVESYSIGPTFSWLISLSFRVYQASHSWVMIFSKFDLENPRSRSWVRSKSQCESNILSTHIPLVPCQLALPFLRYSILNLTLKIQGQGHRLR